LEQQHDLVTDAGRCQTGSGGSVYALRRSGKRIDPPRTATS